MRAQLSPQGQDGGENFEVSMDYLLSQGLRIPRLGLGTFRMQGDVCRAAVESALSIGYRHIDTAEMYG
jgi:2,5-diketo-D-gluconate reductase B